MRKFFFIAMTLFLISVAAWSEEIEVREVSSNSGDFLEVGDCFCLDAWDHDSEGLLLVHCFAHAKLSRTYRRYEFEVSKETMRNGEKPIRELEPAWRTEAGKFKLNFIVPIPQNFDVLLFAKVLEDAKKNCEKAITPYKGDHMINLEENIYSDELPDFYFPISQVKVTRPPTLVLSAD